MTNNSPVPNRHPSGARSPPPAASRDVLSTPIAPTSFYANTSPSRLGSSHTSYVPPEASPFREPELVSEEPVDPHSLQDTVMSTTQDWGDVGDSPWGFNSEWAGKVWEAPSAQSVVEIDGRSDEEELNWCDPSLREKCARPGPGVLPPVLSHLLHDSVHTLYSVSVKPPDIHSNAEWAPSADEVRTAVPHPNAYYCKEHNGWVFLLWRFSSVLPPLVANYAPEHPLPDMERRKKAQPCVVEGEQTSGQVNMTHHWHRYPRAVDGKALNPPFMQSSDGSDLLDLYVCCQCSLYCLASGVVKGVLPRELVDEFTRDKKAHPSPDKTPKASIIAGWETVLTILENRLFKNEVRFLPVTRPKFQSKVGWNETVRRVFEILGFRADVFSESNSELALHPPDTHPTTPEGKFNRAKLLRAWVEIAAWLEIYKKLIKDSLGGYIPFEPRAQVDNAREMIQSAIGAHVNQIPRGLLPISLERATGLDEAWHSLGMTPSSYSPKLLCFAYLAQCRCDPANTMVYFTHLFNIVNTMIISNETPPQELQTLIVEERTRYRYTLDDLKEHVSVLGFGRDNDLGVDLDDDVDDEFILQAWRTARRRAWRDVSKGAERRKDLDEAMRALADQRASRVLRQAWEEERGSGMTPDVAYNTLEVPRDVDESMLITVFLMRVEDQPSQADRMREAMSVIAEVTDSERLRRFLSTGRDPGDTSSTTAPDMPRGLNQLGNTCYLNSLLQYFYTIRDLREAVAPLAHADTKSFDDSKFTDDDLKRHRVGGRLVTRREIQRSKKFVSQLAELFFNLEYCEDPAVTPSLDLAKLALVTSQDEEEDDQRTNGTDSSNDTDATLVEDVPMRAPQERSSPSPVKSPADSVLGKRHREFGSSMDVDSPSEPASVPPSPPRDSIPASQVASSSKLKEPEDVEMQDVSRAPSAKAPPLPPRKPRQVDDSVMMFGRQHDVSECMDNCMFQIETALLDFQQEKAAVEDDKTTAEDLILRLFYGKKRQRLTALSAADDARHQSSIHEKEDLFSHLHVNVSEEGYDLYDSLGRYFDDVVELDGQKKRMEVSLVDLPPLLQIQLQRVQFNRETQQAYKSQAYVKFGETVYMDRFLESADPEKKARAKAIQADLNASRDHIQRLTEGNHAPFAPALGNVADFLGKQDIVDLPEADGELVVTVRSEQDLVVSELEKERANAVQLKSQLEDVWKDNRDAAYELTSVFIHRGSSPSWGHYFFYSRNLPDHPDSWFKYNDSSVTVVSKDEVLADTTGSTANPYMLVFTRKGYEAIQTVKRFDPQTLQDMQE
ncbi:cysteine proteinase [Obba rivulosa]|uniref:ubiquitinyl hydrolase 1 n=1 Tax=Obba rivulosa TaxID=1052685 RepID=A0A8E2ASG8_9APHY|nr:cysteine proteinase [Obba rivulosa]